MLSYLGAFTGIFGISSYKKYFLGLFFDWDSRFPGRGRRKDGICNPCWVDFVELEGVCSDGSFLSSVNQPERHLVFKFDLSKELFKTLVKNMDLGTSPEGRSMGICIFNHHPRSILFTLNKDSAYKYHLVSGILTSLGRRL